MKKTILMVLIAASIANIGNAQETPALKKAIDPGYMHFGLKVGANYSNVYDTRGEEFRADPKPGLAAGIFLALPLGQLFGIQPEVLFSQKGFRARGNAFGTQYDFTRTTSYIDIPLYFTFKPGQYITILAGPQYSYLLQQNDRFTNSDMSILQEKEFTNDNVRRNTLCFVGGIDVNIKHIVLGARVGWDIQDNNGDGTSTTPRYKNEWGQATIGYRF